MRPFSHDAPRSGLSCRMDIARGAEVASSALALLGNPRARARHYIDFRRNFVAHPPLAPAAFFQTLDKSDLASRASYRNHTLLPSPFPRRLQQREHLRSFPFPLDIPLQTPHIDMCVRSTRLLLFLPCIYFESLHSQWGLICRRA